LSKIVPSAKNTPNIVNKTATPATTISNPTTTVTNTKETIEHAKRKLDFEEEKENQQQKKDSAKQNDETTDVFSKLISKSVEKLQETENRKEQKNRQILLSVN
jgi:hypothetical protein